jgi:hypothetical protein
MVVDAVAIENFLTVDWPDKPLTGVPVEALGRRIRKRAVKINPCREVVVKKPRPRSV